ncbi:sulfotransferase [Sphingobium lactosutens]|uniref:sulfotransferase family protein n=1 Tax=Sphingobium lactosutens TaxID=522773 RepID=UPI0015BE863A|nr:sulfotransferase [Sphingobium lactosutens]NWK97729.1 sulfotransferase [Sphingobium lactosutens]
MLAKRIDYFIVGVQKAGTTSLFELLRSHPALAAPSRKELHFFDDERRDWTAPDYGDLELHFENSGDGHRFDVTPIYCFWPQSMERLQRYNPDARLILLFRDPFERAWSHWCMQYARGREKLPFAAAIRAERDRLRNLPIGDAGHRHFSYVARGAYGSQLRRVQSLFPDDQLLLLTAEDLARDQDGVLARISDFLDIAPFPRTPPVRAHQRPAIAYPSEPRAEDRAFVHALLGEEMRDLSRLTGARIHYPACGQP